MENNQRIYKIQKSKKEIQEKCVTIPNKSGIYILTRYDLNGFKYAYIGQSVHILDRLAEHTIGWQEIDNSIKKHGWYSLDNVEGWKIQYLLCPQQYLDRMEQEYIKAYADLGYQLKNKTGGGQGVGKVGLDNRRSPKGYFDGIEQGRKKLIKELQVYFDKYLDVSIKGNSNSIKERKLNEFKMLLKVDNTY